MRRSTSSRTTTRWRSGCGGCRRVLDGLIVVFLLAWPDVPVVVAPSREPRPAPTAAVLGFIALALAQSVAAWWRRQRLGVVFVLVGGVLLTRTLLHQDPISACAALTVALYGVGAYGGRRLRRWCAAGCVEGEPRPLPPGVDVSAYRIVQEALTNVLKYAGPAHARVLVRYGPGELELRVSDDGRGPPPGADGLGGGHGLVGMRERVALFDGELYAGPRPGGGFDVRARLPFGQVPA